MRTKKETIEVEKKILVNILKAAQEATLATERHIKLQNDRLLAIEGQIAAKNILTSGDPQIVKRVSITDAHHDALGWLEISFTEPDNVGFRTTEVLRQSIKLFRQHGIKSIKINWHETYGR